MPVLTITVDHTTGIVTSVAHGLNTGDGPGALYTPNGALPTGWAPVTDYWFIRLSADTLKLASSSANAMAGVALALPGDNGSGTLELLVGLPYRRATTYVPKAVSVPGSQVKSADLNALEDDDIALWNLLTGQAQSIYDGIKLSAAVDFRHAGDWPMPFSFADFIVTLGTATYTAPGSGITPSAPMTAVAGLQGLRHGDVITSVDFGLAEQTASWTYALCRRPTTAAGAEAVIATGTINAGTVNTTTRTLAAVNHQVDVAFAYYLRVTASAGAGELVGGTVHLTH